MRAFVILGIILLVVTIAGVAYTQSSPGKQAQKKDANGDDPPTRIACLGFFDVEAGVAGLYPKQFGDVVELARENTKVKQGDLLLQVDDTLAKLKVEEAKAAVQASTDQLELAKILPDLYKFQANEQQSAVDEVTNEIKKLEKDREIRMKPLTQDDPLRKTTLEFFQYGFDQLNAKKKAQEAKLGQIKLQNAKLKIGQAEADLKGKNLQLKEAQEALKHFKILAPSDGTVLRVYVHKGETLGPNPRYHAIDFLPESPVIVRAEVLQEWVRFVHDNSDVTIEDDVYHGPTWKGKVKSISKWFAQTRTPVIEPFRYNDVRTLECIITITDGPATKRIGQRVRAMVEVK